ncbi:MAG: GNAT family N-acetyltransferase [Beijerinckiaceae bacterium]
MRLPDPLPELRTSRLLLRRQKHSDVEDRLALGRDEEVYRMFGADISKLTPFTFENAISWVDSIAYHPAAWVIDLNGKAIGEIMINNPVDADQRAGLAIGILDPRELGKGLGSEAVSAVATFCFTELNLHRLTIRVLAFNERAIKAYEKIGFVREGVEREAARVGDKWIDDVIMGLLQRDFQPVV